MRKKILIVDDSATVRLILSTTLRGTGYEVIEASDGREALHYLEGEKINMLITDLNMPHLDGIDLIRQVRQTSGFRFMPIIMLTTEADEAKKQEGKSAGVSGWVAKPFKPEQLMAVVNLVMA